MDTTQKPRQEAQRQDTGTPKRTRPEGTKEPQRPARPAGEGRERPAKQPAQRPRPNEERRRAPAAKTEKPKRPAEAAPKTKRPAESASKPKRPAQTAAAPRKRTQEKKPARKDTAKRRPAADADDVSSKKRAYGNSKPKKKSAVVSLMESIEQSAKKSVEKKKKSKGKRPKQPTPAVIYTQPAAFNRNRLIVQLITVTAVVLALVIGLSVFFKVEHIYVSGAEVYSESSIIEVCGISKGDNLLTFSHARAAALIQANRPYVSEVRFGIKLPDTVNIIIEEENVVYAIKDQDEQWWLINSSGRVVEQAQKGQASNYTQILGVALEHPLKDQEAVAVEAQAVAQTPDPDPTGETTEPVVVVPTVSGAQRLSIALQIVQALEDNDIVGDAASINVSQPQSITMWYGTRYQINLGDSGNLEYKIACMNSVILSMQEYDSGILDCSFTVWPDQVSYTPFS